MCFGRLNVALLSARILSARFHLFPARCGHGFLRHKINSSLGFLGGSQATCTLICLGFAFSDLGAVISSNPFLYSAFTLLSSIATGSSLLRTNFPAARSSRW